MPLIMLIMWSTRKLLSVQLEMNERVIMMYLKNHFTACSFCDNGAQPVLLLSTMHGAQSNTNSRGDGKPDIVSLYSTTKDGVDNLDKLARGFRSKRKSRRWLCSVFFTLADVGTVAAQCSMMDKGETASVLF